MSDLKSLRFELNVDSDEGRAKVEEVKDILNDINYFSEKLSEAIEELEGYDSSFALKYSVAASSRSSFQESQEE